MKIATLLFIAFVTISSFTYAQTVTIGTQVWMTKNLDVATFRNGDSIPEAKTDEEWNKSFESKKPAWCYYDNDPAKGVKYGRMYNWYAVNDSRGLAPVGYHVPTDAEWSILTEYLGGDVPAGTKMKSKSGWNSVNTGNGLKSGNGTNTSGFSGLPGGQRYFYGQFNCIGIYGQWWSSTEGETHSAWSRNLYYGLGFGLGRSNPTKNDGLSVRCVRD
jgi:uncharacterized protein (TIGR02145 family)